MKYVVTLNGKNYEVDVNETDAIVTDITEVLDLALTDEKVNDAIDFCVEKNKNEENK